MNIIGLATIMLIVCGAMLSPVLLLWGAYCLTRRARRMEGVIILALGSFAAALLVTVGVLTAPPHSPGILRFQAFVIIAGVFGIGAAGGKVLYLAGSRWRASRLLTK